MNRDDTQITTRLRLIFLVLTLIDCKTKHVSEVVNNINEYINAYYEGYPKLKPSDYKELTPNTFNNIENIKKEPWMGKNCLLKRKYQTLNGKTGYFYCINTKAPDHIFIFAFLIIANLQTIGLKDDDDKNNDFLKAGCKFLESPYAKHYINPGLIKFLESRIKVEIASHIKDYLIYAAKISPSALFNLIILTNVIPETMNSKGAVYLLLHSLTNAVIRDIQSYYSSNIDFEINQYLTIKIDNKINKIIKLECENKNKKLKYKKTAKINNLLIDF